MSNTRKKLEEAKYFLEQMQVCVEDDKQFPFNLSAFLSAARSVTFIMQREFKTFPGFSDWYEDKQKEMNNNEDFRFFKSLRDTTIHKKPVMPLKEIIISITATIASSVTIRVINEEGNIISEQTSEPKKAESPKEPEVTTKWCFDERPDEELLGLCNKYIQNIEKLVEECEKQFHKD